MLLAQQNSINEHKDYLFHVLDTLGWTINWEKSSLDPTLYKKFIVYLIDNRSEKTIIKIPKDRIRKVRKDILTRGVATARALARVAGQCVSMYN